MNFEDEPYVRLYTRKTLTSKMLGWEGRVQVTERRVLIDRLERDGADMVGMTGMPEAALAREAAVAYAALGVVANWAAGRASSRSAIALADIAAVLETAMARVAKVLMHLEVPAAGPAGP